MPCTIDTLLAVRCNDQTLMGETIQRSILLQFLCLIALEVDPGGGACSIEALLAQAESLVCVGGVAQQKLIQMQAICTYLDVDCTQPVCSQSDIMEAAISILVCRIVSAIATPA